MTFCSDSEACHDDDACNIDLCDPTAGCSHEPLPDDVLPMCRLQLLRTLLQASSPPLCTGRCNCATLGAAVDRIDFLLMKTYTASTRRRCKKSLKRTKRKVHRLMKQIRRMSRRGCLAPIATAEGAESAANDLLSALRAHGPKEFCALLSAATTTTTLEPLLHLGRPIATPPIVRGSVATAVTVTVFVSHAPAMIELLRLTATGTLPLGEMRDDGVPPDVTRGDHTYSAEANIEATSDANVTFVVRADTPTGPHTRERTVPVVHIDSLDTSDAIAEFYSVAVATRDRLLSPDRDTDDPYEAYSLITMFQYFESITGQDVGLSLWAPAVNAYSCNDLVNSLPGNPTPPGDLIDPDDPSLLALEDLIVADNDCGILSRDDFGNGSAYLSYVCARRYVNIHSIGPIAGCTGAQLDQLERVAIKDEVTGFTDLAGDGVGGLFDQFGFFVSEGIQGVFNTFVGWVVDQNLESTIVVGRVSDGEATLAPTGNYHLTFASGTDAPPAATGGPVNPNEDTVFHVSYGTETDSQPPELFGFTPQGGDAGTTVTITGAHFAQQTSANVVTFQGTGASVLDAQSDHIVAEVPLGTTTGPITVRTPDGTATTADDFISYSTCEDGFIDPGEECDPGIMPAGCAFDSAACTAKCQCVGLQVVPPTILREFAAPQPPDQSFVNGRGMAFDGTDLWFTFDPTRNPETKIYKADVFGNLLDVKDIGVGIGALAFDPATGHFFGGAYSNSSLGHVYDIDPASSVASLLFVYPFPLGDSCFEDQAAGLVDGLAYRGDTKQLYISDDAARTVIVASTSGEPLERFGMRSTGGGCNSGIAFDGTGLWLVDAFYMRIFHVMGMGVADAVLRTGDYFTEDVAFDPVTFAPNCALWTNEATATNVPRIRAYEVPCPIL